MMRGGKKYSDDYCRGARKLQKIYVKNILYVQVSFTVAFINQHHMVMRKKQRTVNEL